jgi:hypothetical protein
VSAADKLVAAGLVLDVDKLVAAGVADRVAAGEGKQQSD